jgi:phosphohistidine phosphatase SixA
MDLEAHMLGQRKAYTELFMQAQRVFCSPLTRAIETAVLALQLHPAATVCDDDDNYNDSKLNINIVNNNSSSPGIYLYR